MGDRIGREMRQVSERKGVQRLVPRLFANLEPDVPRVAVAAGGGVLLGDARVGRDRPVEEVVWKGREQLGDGRREKVADVVESELRDLRKAIRRQRKRLGV